MEHSIRATGSSPVYTMSGSTGGTGSRFARAVTIVAGVAALVATILTFLYVILSCTHTMLALLLSPIADLVSSDQHGSKGMPYRHRPSPQPSPDSSSKNYRKPLLQRYVIRILIMFVFPPSYACLSVAHLLQGAHLLGLVMGESRVP